jgi:quinol monooxygenase YgiN
MSAWIGTGIALFDIVVQLLVRLVAPRNGVPDLLQALRSVMRPAQQARGCRFAQIYVPANDDRSVEYVEEWDNAEELQSQFDSDRFVRLLGVLETASEKPVLEFRIVAETHGIEYITSGKCRPAPPRRRQAGFLRK